MMNRTWRAIGVSAFVMLAVLGTGWAVEKASSGSRTQGTAAVSGLAKTSDPVTTPATREPSYVRSTTESSPEYDRSDLILSQG